MAGRMPILRLATLDDASAIDRVEIPMPDGTTIAGAAMATPAG